jgi:hypothetical protein
MLAEGICRVPEDVMKRTSAAGAARDLKTGGTTNVGRQRNSGGGEEEAEEDEAAANREEMADPRPI